ncbi:hypothetical protein FRC12_014784 [Ceratobasidium sp. 428]|nr:hypothetical protein FRC12_014784 [Ceratobasidium sp. 428]
MTEHVTDMEYPPTMWYSDQRFIPPIRSINNPFRALIPTISSFCSDPEGISPISRSRRYDFTPCFEQILHSACLAIFLLFAFIRCIQLFRRKARVDSEVGEMFRDTKFMIGVLPLLVISSISFAFGIRRRGSKFSLVMLEEIVSVVAFVLLGLLTYLNHTRTRRSSTILLTFWPFYVLLQLASLRTHISMYSPRGQVFALRCALLGASVMSWALECLCPDQAARDPDAEPDEKESPYEYANIYSRLTFGWMTPLMKLGYRRYITEKDVTALPPDDTARTLSDKLQQQWSRQLRSSKPSLWSALFRAYGGPYAVAALLKLVRDALSFAGPQLLRFLLMFVARYQAGEAKSTFLGWVIALAMFVVSILQTLVLHQYFQICILTGMRVRAGLVTAVYDKALVQASDSQGARGDIVNLMSVDASRLQELCISGLIAISGPFQIVLAFVSLYELLGWAAFVGVGVMIISLPLNTFIARMLKNMQRAQMKNRDKRTRLMSELLNNIKSIKLYAWEDSFISQVLKIRNDEELRMLRKIGVTNAVNTTLWTGVPLLVAFGSFATAAYTGSKALTPDVVATVTSQVVESTVSVARVRDFLLSEELQSDAREVDETEVAEGDVVLEIRGGEFKWSKTAVQPTLEGVDLSARKGELIGVLGPVGCGKTSLLSAILGKMVRAEGTVKVHGRIAYAPQNPWMMNATIRDNILFSHRYDEEFYNIVLDGVYPDQPFDSVLRYMHKPACALRPDLAQFPDGDLTEVGERGITLSGGQRARISLARAVYARADLYLLDDPLAAVDAHVARHLFDQVIGPDGLLAGKTRLHVTNGVSYLSQHDLIVMIRRGIILESSTFEDAIGDPGSEIAKLIASSKTSSSRGHSGTATPANEATGASEATLVSVPAPAPIPPKPAKDTAVSFLQRRPSVVLPRDRAKTKTQSKAEHREQGKVKADVYKRYFRAASLVGVIFYVLCVIVQQGCSILSNIALREWGNYNQRMGGNSDIGYYLFVYGMLGLGASLFSFLGSVLLWVYCAIKSARSLHDTVSSIPRLLFGCMRLKQVQMLFAVLRSPLSFFEQTPMGRIMNLFSRDQYVIDEALIRVINAFLRTLLQIIGVVVVIGGTFPLFFALLIPLGFVYRFIMLYYLATSRELKRLDAVTKSPIFAWFQESLGGLSTIRGFSQERVFTCGNEAKLDQNQMIYYPAVSANRWVAIRIELLGSFIVVSAAVLSLTALFTTGIDAGLVGLVLSYSLSATQSLNLFIRSASDVEQNLVSVERVLNYVNLPPEEPLEIPDATLPNNWPQRGEIEFQNYSMRYRPELAPVLKDLNLTIHAGENVGVVGRTGAGKSSLFLGLLRILEPAAGTILVHGEDIKQLGLRDLRRAISIVPQEPQLFEGTVRENVNPTAEYDDGRIWDALEKAHLKEFVIGLPGGLDAGLKEGGLSLSSGQRQLVCFARALLRKTKILILDEATSAMDIKTDKAIQEILRGPVFEGVTTLTIAHRLNTVIDSDRIIVLDAGSVTESGEPEELLKNQSSLFYALAAEAGILSEST